MNHNLESRIIIFDTFEKSFNQFANSRDANNNGVSIGSPEFLVITTGVDSEFCEAYEGEGTGYVTFAAEHLRRHHPLSFALAVENKDAKALRRLLIIAINERCGCER